MNEKEIAKKYLQFLCLEWRRTAREQDEIGEEETACQLRRQADAFDLSVDRIDDTDDWEKFKEWLMRNK